MIYTCYNLVYSCTLIKTVQCTLPTKFALKLTFYRKFHSYYTRNSHAFRLLFCLTNIKQFSAVVFFFFYQGPKFYSYPSTDIFNSTTTASF